MKRAAIYARYSSDLQNDRSIDDQIALCRTYATRNDLDVVALYDDRSMSGASFMARTGLQRLLAGAGAGAFDAVICETQARLGRDQADIHTIAKRLEFHGVAFVTVSDGAVTPIIRGMRAIIDEQYLADLRAMTRRGMAGVIRQGRHAGGRAYGYRTTPGTPGALQINAAEADVIRRIFALYLAGQSARTIAGTLNAERVPPPRGDSWRASSIIGSKQRGHGILINQLYAGRIVWNRVRMVRHPESRRRISRVNPPSEWMTIEAPALRIIDAATFDQVQVRVRERSFAKSRGRLAPRYMLSGLLYCGACGAGMSVRGTDRKGRRINCTRAMEAKACDNTRGYYLDDIEHAVVHGLQKRLGSRAAIAHYIRAHNAASARQDRAANDDRARLERELAAAQRSLNRMIDAHIREHITDEEARTRLPILRAERDRLRTALGSIDTPVKVVTLHPAAVDAYLQSLNDMARLINSDLATGDPTIAAALRKLVNRVTVMPARAGTRPTIVVAGRLETLLKLPVFTPGSLSRGALVAGGGLGETPATEPPSFSFACQA